MNHFKKLCGSLARGVYLLPNDTELDQINFHVCASNFRSFWDNLLQKHAIRLPAYSF